MNTSFSTLFFLALLGLLASCASKKFVEEEVCAPTALRYLKNAKDRDKGPLMSRALQEQLKATQQEMQQCYEEFYQRTGKDEFRTCLIVGVDVTGMMDYYNFSSQDIRSDKKFVQCAVRVTKRIPYWQYGTNYTLMQTYNFYKR